MLKLNIKLLIVVLLLISSFAYSDYVPLTREEAGTYLDSATREQLIDDIIKLDIIENSVPIILDPGYTALLDENGDLIIFPLDKFIVLSIGGYLEYEIECESYIITDFKSKDSNKRAVYFLIGFGIGLLGGTILMTGVSK